MTIEQAVAAILAAFDDSEDVEGDVREAVFAVYALGLKDGIEAPRR